MKLTPRASKQLRSRSVSSNVIGSCQESGKAKQTEQAGIICRERQLLAEGKGALLHEYYDNLEKVVLELAKAQQFLDCVRELR